MTSSNQSIKTISIPIFLIVERSSFFDIRGKFLTKKIQFFEEFYSIFCFYLQKSHVLYREKYRCHDESEYRHAKHDLNQGKSSFFEISLSWKYRHFSEK